MNLNLVHLYLWSLGKAFEHRNYLIKGYKNPKRKTFKNFLSIDLALLHFTRLRVLYLSTIFQQMASKPKGVGPKAFWYPLNVESKDKKAIWASSGRPFIGSSGKHLGPMPHGNGVLDWITSFVGDSN